MIPSSSENASNPGDATRRRSGVKGAYRTGVRVLRGSPELATLAGGWLASEFPPQVVVAQALSSMRVTPVDRVARLLAAQGADSVLDSALRHTFGDEHPQLVRHPIDRSGPARRPSRATIVRTMRHRGRYAALTRDIPYESSGPAGLLDIWRRQDLPPGHRAPVLVHIPGGAWTVNDKRGQGYALMGALVRLGWICVSINYRRSPHHPWPAQIVDVKRALAWVRRHIADYGGDPGFIAMTGGSAGAHLCALAALTANDPVLQPGFEEADTAVQAVVPHYGIYDLTQTGDMHKMMFPFLERVVFQAKFVDDPGLFEAASPIFHVDAKAPPFLILHGDKDRLIPHTRRERDFRFRLTVLYRLARTFSSLPTKDRRCRKRSRPRSAPGRRRIRN